MRLSSFVLGAVVALSACSQTPVAQQIGCPSGTTQACGITGSSCVQACQADGGFGTCQLPSGPVDTNNDPLNCGMCGNACPVPLHAAALCLEGVCGRGPCQAGFFDLDGQLSFGCEATCTSTSCTGADGGVTPVTAPPLAETGDTFHSFASGAAFAGSVQTNAAHTNIAILGESTPPGVDGGAVQSNSTHVNQSGFTPIEGSGRP